MHALKLYKIHTNFKISVVKSSQNRYFSITSIISGFRGPPVHSGEQRQNNFILLGKGASDSHRSSLLPSRGRFPLPTQNKGQRHYYQVHGYHPWKNHGCAETGNDRFCSFMLRNRQRLSSSTVVILLKATKHAKREQINKSHWLIEVSRTHFIGRELFPKHDLFSFLNFCTNYIFLISKILTKNFTGTFRIWLFFLKNIVIWICMSLL